MIKKYTIKFLNLFLLLIFVHQLNAQTDRILIEVANTRHEFGEYQGAIEAFTLAIELNPKSQVAYNNRGISKSVLGDDRGAIEDFSKSIDLNENYLPAYLNRAASKYNLEDYYGAIEDYTVVIEQNPENAIAWYGRGISYLQVKYIVGVCEDLNNAYDLGYNDARELIEEHCRTQ